MYSCRKIAKLKLNDASNVFASKPNCKNEPYIYMENIYVFMLIAALDKT